MTCPGRAGVLQSPASPPRRRPAVPARRSTPAWPALRVALSALSALTLVACSPALDWRDVRPQGSGARLQFPCKPHAQTRSVALAGPAVALALHACEAGGLTWALAVADVDDPGRVAPALAELRAAAAANAAAAEVQAGTLQVAGATPNEASARLRLKGSRPDGAPLQVQSAVFAHGTRVFQATVLGEVVAEDAAQVFFDSLRVGP